MRLFTPSGKLVYKNLERFRIRWDDPTKSKSQIQFAVKQFLKPFWFAHVVFEEMPVFGTRLHCDIVNMTRRIAVEVDGNQHENFNTFFHGGSRLKYLGSIKRDVAKEEWLEKNQIRLVRIYQDEAKTLTEAFFKEKFGIAL